MTDQDNSRPNQTIDGDTLVATPPVTESAGSEPAKFPVVGIGASAGGLAAFETFFSGMPLGTEPNIAFVLVQHLAPDHKSFLSAIVQRYTSMKVFEVEDGMKLSAGCAYIIPPNRDMVLRNGALQLIEPSAPRGQRMPIDHFFRSLAEDQRELAVGIVLAGTGSDGTLGIRALKGEGGMVMAQDPANLEYDGMPRSAINTGLVDYVLPPNKMVPQLLTYVEHAIGRASIPEVKHFPINEQILADILVVLRNQTGHDFAQYKPSTVRRRIARRMTVHQLETIEEYAEFLRGSPAEGSALFRDMLIGVTSFFRDKEVFLALESQVVPRLFTNKPTDGTIRVWVPGCSTGEEAYSIAILLAERQAAMKRSFKVQIFATDIDAQAIALARSGLYPASVASDISAERLALYFSAEPDGNTYRVQKSIRDMLVFSEQNVIKDPPFSRLDLISCRNLLIYLGAELQKRLIPLFHYALIPSGYLFLGTSETVGEFNDFFITLDRKAKLYQRNDGLLASRRSTLGRLLLPTKPDVPVQLPNGMKSPLGKPSLRELTEQNLLRHFTGAGVLVNAHGDLLYLHGRTGLYLEPAPGESGVNNILKMAREGLRHALSTALYQSTTDNESVVCQNVSVKTNGHYTQVKLLVHPVVTESSSVLPAPLYLVVLEPVEPNPLEQAPKDTAPPDNKIGDAVMTNEETTIVALRQEVLAKEEYLRNATEELETTNEELRSANEEMQSVNEELQSTNEELETSKEELQSLNEELATVNAELQTKVADLTQANNDMNNLLAGTGIGTVFVNHQMRIMRFTPAITHIINLISSDAGRPVGHIVSNLIGYNRLVEDTRAVLDTLVPKEVEVQTLAGLWYSMRILPYRTLNNVIEGAVITFIDITAAKLATDALRAAGINLSSIQRKE